MLDRLLVGVDDLDGEDEREELLGEVLLGGGDGAVEQRAGALLGPQLDPGVAQRGARRGQECGRDVGVTSSVSAALQVPGRWVLALSTIRSASSRSAVAST